MCFSIEMSAAFAVLMWTYCLLWRKGPLEARLCIGYFAAMETLQAAQYTVVDQCDNPVNKVLTLLGFLHLAFQPFFVNMYLSCFMNKAQKKYKQLCCALALFSGVLLTNRFWKTWGDIDCTNNIEPLCGPKLCSFQGDVHIAWQMPMQHADQDYFTPGFFTHFFTFYLPTYAIGMWPYTVFLLASGPFLGRVLTSHQDEIPAIWCFFSIAQVVFPMLHAYITKTSVFDPKQQALSHASTKHAHTNGHARANGTTATPDIKQEEEEEDAVGGYSGMCKRALYLAIALTIKRFGTMFLQTAQMPVA